MAIKNNRKGQALLELAIFGGLILLIFGILLSYLQNLNDQQYVQMETFRRALKIANVDNASAQLTSMENRRHTDLGSYFMKGSSGGSSSSANIFWAVPAVGAAAPHRTYVKVNEDLSPDLSEGEGLENIETASETIFNENVVKQETPQSIANIKSSGLKDTLTTTLVDKDGNTIWEVKQGLYRDSDGQYKYSKDKLGTEVQRSQTWETEF